MRRPSSRLAFLALAATLTAGVAAQDLTLPNKPSGTLKFAVIGDSGAITAASQDSRRASGRSRLSG